MRVYIFLFIIIGLEIILNFAGLNASTGFILTTLGINTPENLANNSTPFYYDLNFIILSLGLAGVAIGLFAGGGVEVVLLASFVGFLLKFSADFIFILTYVNANYCAVATASTCWIKDLIFWIWIPITIGFMFSVVSWWFNRD